jgi:hypothetical protein
MSSDASAQRIPSDLATLVFSRDHRLIIAGDWNILLGDGEFGDPYWKERYETVFERAAVLGLQFVRRSIPTAAKPGPGPTCSPGTAAV